MIKTTIRSLLATLGPHRYPTKSPRLWILMYHRVLPHADPRGLSEEPGMVVTPESFRLHLQCIGELFDVVRLSDWIETRAAGGRLPARACAITFDDGWVDNYEYAWPLLREFNVPATIFVVTGMVGTMQTFWPNRVARLLRSVTPNRLLIREMEWLRPAIPWRGQSEFTPEQLAVLIDYCKSLPERYLLDRLTAVEDALGVSPSRSPALLDWLQLKEMVDSGLVDAGSHTCSHKRLNDTAPHDLIQREVSASKATLENILNRPVTLFCYPNGDTCHAARTEVARHYAAAVTTQRGINTMKTSPHDLLRIGIHEDIAHTRRSFLARLSGWI